MKIEQLHDGNKLTVVLSGHLDTVTAPQLESELKLDGVQELVFDISGVSYVSSAGLRVFLSTYKTMAKQGSMSIHGAAPVVKEVFDLTGFSTIFHLD